MHTTTPQRLTILLVLGSALLVGVFGCATPAVQEAKQERVYPIGVSTSDLAMAYKLEKAS